MPPKKLQEVAVITGSGAFGGLLAWLIAAVNTGLTSNWGLALLLSILAGAAAAGAGIYLLANTDTSNLPRAAFFAVFCGISWDTIVEAGRNLAKDATVHKAVAAAQEKVEQTITQSATGSTQAQINQIVEGTSKLADKLPSTSSQELRQDALQTVQKAVAQIEKFGEHKPDAATDALQAIGQRASASGSLGVKLSAREGLMNLREKSLDAKTWQKADMAIKALQ